MSNLPLFTPITIHVNNVSFVTSARWEPNLPLAKPNQYDAVVVYGEGTNESIVRGLHISLEGRWRFCIPFEELALTMYYGSTVQVYNRVHETTQFLPASSVYRNGIKSTDVATVSNIDAIWGTVTRQTAKDIGGIQSVSGNLPDESGNVNLTIEDIDGLLEALNAIGRVASVNGQLPDLAGNVQIDIDHIQGLREAIENSGSVKTVNSVAPDEDGNVTVGIQDIAGLDDTLDSLGSVKTVNSVAPDENGNVDLDQQVNYSISLSGQPNPDAVVFYQELVEDLTFVSAYGKVQSLPTEEITFLVYLDDELVGGITFDQAGTATSTVTIPEVISRGSIIYVQSPSDLFNSAVFSIVFSFMRD